MSTQQPFMTDAQGRRFACSAVLLYRGCKDQPAVPLQPYLNPEHGRLGPEA